MRDEQNPVAGSAGASGQGQDDPSDQVLVDRIVVGEEDAAFAVLYGRYAPTVARRLRRILGRVDDVEDLLQQTFIEVHRSLKRYDTGQPFGPWLGGITFRVVGRHLRSRKRRRWLEPNTDRVEGVAASGQPAEASVINQDLVARLQQAMEDLSPPKRIAFAMHELEEMGYTEIATVLGTSPQTVWARVQSARKKIRKRLESLDKTAIERGRRSVPRRAPEG